MLGIPWFFHASPCTVWCLKLWRLSGTPDGPDGCFFCSLRWRFQATRLVLVMFPQIHRSWAMRFLAWPCPVWPGGTGNDMEWCGHDFDEFWDELGWTNHVSLHMSFESCRVWRTSSHSRERETGQIFLGVQKHYWTSLAAASVRSVSTATALCKPGPRNCCASGVFHASVIMAINKSTWNRHKGFDTVPRLQEEGINIPGTVDAHKEANVFCDCNNILQQMSWNIANWNGLPKKSTAGTCKEIPDHLSLSKAILLEVEPTEAEAFTQLQWSVEFNDWT